MSRPNLGCICGLDFYFDHKRFGTRVSRADFGKCLRLKHILKEVWKPKKDLRIIQTGQILQSKQRYVFGMYWNRIRNKTGAESKKNIVSERIR